MHLREFEGLTAHLFFFGELDTALNCAARNAGVELAIEAMGGEEAVMRVIAMRLLATKEVDLGDMIAVSRPTNEAHSLWAIVEAASAETKTFSVGLYGFPVGRVKHLTNTGQGHLVESWLQKNPETGGIKLVSALGKIWTSKQDPEKELAIGACAVVDQLSQGRTLLASFEGVRNEEVWFEYWVANKREMAELRSQAGALAA